MNIFIFILALSQLWKRSPNMKTNSPSYKRKPPNSTSVTNLRLLKRRNSPWKKRIRRWVIDNQCICSPPQHWSCYWRIWFREILKSILKKFFQIYNSVSNHHFSSSPPIINTPTPPQIYLLFFYNIGNNY